MPILNIQPLNKRDQRITLENGSIIDISVRQIFNVNFYQEDAVIGHVTFESLSSLNNLELQPVYKLKEESLTHPALSTDATQLREAAITLYRTYTNGKILPNKDMLQKSH
ncbi:hypothetical protein SAMN05192560_1168 [Methylobacillus rhizosphaerae]|uniref:Uncharacterized protein n=1 Tax=Methylobacillus rhizosphaerae TaxID=551994 RepID=A0A238ZB53_9PROT|nr:hypothetical protein [Methylobacillus rhizosphaerae]SNR80289.1 hypothetical protein SAMN05192560_1168 [Methylobacillus rhizosphaerae]